MKIRLTKMVLPEQGLKTGKIFEVEQRDGKKLGIRSPKGHLLWIYPNEWTEVKDDK